MKASSHENTCKTTMRKIKKQTKTKSSDPWARSGERPGRGHGSELFFFGSSMVFCSLAKTSRKPKNTKKKSSDPWARSGLSTHKSKKQKNKKNKKPKKQKTKKKKNQDCTPQGEGVRCRVLGLVFLFFWFFGFLVFWFLGFLFFWFFGLCVDSHCRCAKQRLPGTVSGCTRSKVDTLQYSNVCYEIVHSANE